VHDEDIRISVKSCIAKSNLDMIFYIQNIPYLAFFYKMKNSINILPPMR
jgi:hypothetical protein